MKSDITGRLDFDENFMGEAIKESIKAAKADEVPIGCVIVNNGKIIGRGHNRTLSLQDPTAHAEMLAITAASEHLESWRLIECTVYSTIEPCFMCAGALILSRIDRLVYGAPDPKFGACGSLYNVGQDNRLNHNFAVSSGILLEQCSGVMQEFFKIKRKNKI